MNILIGADRCIVHRDIGRVRGRSRCMCIDTCTNMLA